MLTPMSRRPAERAAARAVFAHMRKAWSPRAAYFLARLRHGPTSESRIGAALFLAAMRIPPDGAAPSLNFPGLPFPPRGEIARASSSLFNPSNRKGL